jgi:hypothetical protein
MKGIITGFGNGVRVLDNAWEHLILLFRLRIRIGVFVLRALHRDNEACWYALV